MGAQKTSVINFQAAPSSTVEDSNGMVWTIETNAASISYDATYGACFQSFQAVNNVRASSVKFTSPHIKGRIHQITINASSSDATSVTILQASNKNRPSLTNAPKDYEIKLYAEIDGTFTIEISNTSSLIQRISINSIKLIYDEGVTTAETHYEQVTALDQLKHNDEIIITSKKNGANRVYRVLGNTHGKGRLGYDVTGNDDGTIDGNSINVNSPILLEESGSYWHLRATDGYLYDGSTSNNISDRYLYAGSLDMAGKNANVSFIFDNGEATLCFPQNSTIAKYLYLIDTSSPFIFNCSNNITKLCIFRKIKQEPETIDITFKEKFGGWTSVYYQDKNLVVPEDFTAYAYTVTDGEGATSTPYTTGEIIPKNTAVLLKLNDGHEEYDADGIKTVTVQTTDSEGTQPEDNTLLGSEEGGTTLPPSGNSGDFEFFRLTLNANSDPGSIGFYWGAADGGPFTVGAHKAYLALPKPQSSPLSAIPLRIIPYLLGDANGDGRVNVSDVMVVINYILGNKPKVIKLVRSDVNIDTNINVTDVMGIVRIILGNTNQ